MIAKNPAMTWIFVAGLLAGCVTEPPPLPQHNPADPQAHAHTKAPANLLARDETTLAIEKRLSATEGEAKSAEKMEHYMQNMPAMQHSGMQQGEMKMESQSQMQQGRDLESEKKAVDGEMKKTADEMKATSGEMKKKSDELKTEGAIYTCPMHPQVRSDKPGKCPICGMTLVKKEKAHENH